MGVVGLGGGVVQVWGCPKRPDGGGGSGVGAKGQRGKRWDGGCKVAMGQTLGGRS